MQEEYSSAAAAPLVANAHAAALFFGLLVKAQEPVQQWGLEVWTRLLQGSMANLAACDRYAPARPRLGCRILTALRGELACCRAARPTWPPATGTPPLGPGWAAGF